MSCLVPLWPDLTLSGMLESRKNKAISMFKSDVRKLKRVCSEKLVCSYGLEFVGELSNRLCSCNFRAIASQSFSQVTICLL